VNRSLIEFNSDQKKNDKKPSKKKRELLQRASKSVAQLPKKVIKLCDTITSTETNKKTNEI
jgi:hypothetical protein